MAAAGGTAAEAGLRKALQRLEAAENKLEKAEAALQKAEESDPVDEQWVAKAELGIAKAKVGVAEAKVGVAEASGDAVRVAEARVGVAEAKVGVAEASGDGVRVAEARVGVAEAKVGVAEAKWQAAPEGEEKERLWILVERAQAPLEALRAAAPPHGQVAAEREALDRGDERTLVQALEKLAMETKASREEQKASREEARDTLAELPNQIVTKLKEPAAKKGSSCTSEDWQAFCFAEKGSLEIPALENAALNMYQTILDSTEKHLFLQVPASQAKLSITEAFAELDLTKERPNVHALTSVFVEECLKTRGKRSLQLDSEVGYFSEKWGKYGFGDKAAFSFVSVDTPSQYRPSTTNVSKGFWSPVLLVGAIEEKALGVKLDNAAMAELASEMAGYVEAASKVHGIMFASFPGMLISVHDVQGSKQFLGRCVQWCLQKGGERRFVSSDLVDFKQFCAGLEWWFKECEALLAAAQEVLKKRPTIPVMLVLQEATDTGSEHSNSNDDADETASLEQEAQAPIPIQGTLSGAVLCEKKLESLQHSQLIQSSHKASSSLQYWLLSTISVAQCHQQDPATLLPYQSNDPV